MVNQSHLFSLLIIFSVTGQISGRWPSIGSGIAATQDKQGKNPITGIHSLDECYELSHSSVFHTPNIVIGS